MRAGQPGGSPVRIEKAEPEPVDFDAAHAELLADSSIQFDLRPADQSPPPERHAETRTPSSGFNLPSADAGSGALALFWVAIGLAACGLLYLIVTRLAGWQRSGRDAPGGQRA
jgi:hypothetical protein